MNTQLPTPSFWATIDEARSRTQRPAASADTSALRTVLEAQPTEDVVRFVQSFDGGLAALNSWEVWGAGHTACHGMSDDGFAYFRCWILGLGERAFETARTNPDDLGPFFGPNEFPENELLWYVGSQVLEQRGIDFDGIPREEGVVPEGEPKGRDWDPDDLPERYPRLSAQFGGMH